MVEVGEHSQDGKVTPAAIVISIYICVIVSNFSVLVYWGSPATGHRAPEYTQNVNNPGELNIIPVSAWNIWQNQINGY